MNKLLGFGAGLLIVGISAACLADPNLTDKENFEKGSELHQRGKYQDAYDLYFKDMSPTPKNLKWLEDYRTKHLSGAISNMPDTVGHSRAPVSKPFQNTSVFIKTGLGVPVRPDEFSDYWKMGYGFGGGVGTKVSRITTVQVDVQHTVFPLNETKFQDELYLLTGNPDAYNVRYSGGDSIITTVLLNARVHFSKSDAKVKAYFIGGLGIGIVTITDATVYYRGDSEMVNGSSENKLALRLGFGVDFKVGKHAYLFLEDNGISIATEGESTAYGCLDLGLRFDL